GGGHRTCRFRAVAHDDRRLAAVDGRARRTRRLVAGVTLESDAERAMRRRQRALFDSVADLYDASRVGYPDELISFVLATAGVGTGAPVLEVGCGTGQLSRQLVEHGVALHAIDLGPTMISRARQRVSGSVFEVAT